MISLLWNDPSIRLLIVAIAGALEGFGVPGPGVIVLAGAGMAAGASWPGLLFLAAVYGAGYCAGALGQYRVGRRLGPRALAWLSQKQRTKLQRVTSVYGPAAVLLTRPFAIGNYISLPVGITRMSLSRFLPYTFLGIWPWAFAFMVAGKEAGGYLALLPGFLENYALPTALGLAGVGLIAVAWRLLRRGTPPAPVEVEECVAD